MSVLFLIWVNLLPAVIRSFFGGFDPLELVLTILYSLVFALPLFFLGKYSKRYLWSLFGPLMVLGLVDLFYAYVFKSQLVLPVMSTIFESNPGESSEFLSMYLSLDLLVLAIFYVLVAVPLVHFARPFPSMPLTRKILRVGMLSLALVIMPLKSGNWASAFSYHSGLKPLIMLTEYVTEYRHYLQGRDTWQKSGKFSPITSLEEVDLEQTIVLVIGESLTRRHMSLYGYGRPTTPILDLMAKQDELKFYAAQSPSFVTVESLKTLTTFATVEKKDDYYQKGNIIDYFKQAGFRTFWFSNQQMIEGRITAVSANAYSADEYRFLNKSGTDLAQKSYDQILLPALQSALNNPAKKKLIVLHLLGSHMSYKNRYPDNWKDSFKENKNYPPFALTAWQRKMVDEYDTSVLYTDWLMGQILYQLKAIPHRAAMVFLSDHGEEVFDSMNFVGHVDTSKVVFEIPLMTWVNNVYRAQNPGVYKRMIKAQERNWRADGLPHLLIEMARLTSEEFDPRQSLISPVY